jgi:PAS domain S-box-containing protein
VKVVYEQLIAIGINFHTLTIHHVIDTDDEACHSHEIGPLRQVGQREFASSRVIDMWKGGEVIYRPDMRQYRGGLAPSVLKSLEDRMGLPVRSILDLPHSGGLVTLHSATRKSFSGQDQAIAKRVAGYISLGFSRADDMKNLNEALESARKLAHAVEHSPASVVITDTDGNIEYVNPRFEEATGYAFDEVVGKNPRFLKSGNTPSSAYEHLWKTISDGRIWRGEFYNVKKNGDFYWEAASISSVRNQAGELANYIAVKEEITEKKEMAAAVIAAWRDKVLVQAAGAAAHEINQPLTVILGLTQLLMQTIKDDKLREDLGYVEQAGHAIKQIVQKMSQTERYKVKNYVRDAQIVDFSASRGGD